MVRTRRPTPGRVDASAPREPSRPRVALLHFSVLPLNDAGKLAVNRRSARDPFPKPRSFIMLKTTLNIPSNRLSDAAINASRQMWLASLGASVLTPARVQTEAGDVFKTLVKEGTVVESRAIRFVGDRIETSV